MLLDPRKFRVLSFCVTRSKTHGVRGLSKNCHLRLDHRLVNGKYAIIRTPCVYIACTNILDKPWAIVSDPNMQPR